MKTSSKAAILNYRPHWLLIPAAAIALLLGACATTPAENPAVIGLRANLTNLQSDSVLATRAPVAINEADQAVTAAEVAQHDQNADIDHLIYVADRKLATARARAEGRLAEDQMTALADQRDRIRFAARTREAELARSDIDTQRALAQQALLSAQAQQQAAAARRRQAEMAMLETQEYKRRINDLRAEQTDRGLVVTLGDILFSSGQANIKSGSQNRLDKLVTFLKRYPEQTAMIEGHTDSLGGEDYNLELSQKRADEVRGYLLRHGIATERVTAIGKGKNLPVASNQDNAGRQQNRRVEIILQRRNS